MSSFRPLARSIVAGTFVLGALGAVGAVAARSAAVVNAPAVPPPAAEPRPQGTYVIDAAHSELTFRIRHLVSRVSGSFREWKGTITVDDAERWETARIVVAIQTASIDTNNESRDADLRSGSFFDAATHPVITFRSTRIERAGAQARIHGDLTMRGITKPVVLEGELLGVQPGANGRARVGFEATTTIDRLDWGITWNRALEGGGVTLGDEVTIAMTVAAVEQ